MRTVTQTSKALPTSVLALLFVYWAGFMSSQAAAAEMKMIAVFPIQQSAAIVLTCEGEVDNIGLVTGSYKVLVPGGHGGTILGSIDQVSGTLVVELYPDDPRILLLNEVVVDLESGLALWEDWRGHAAVILHD